MDRQNYRSNFPAVRDQGTRPTCLAFALTDSHAFVRASTEPLSVDFLFYHAARREQNPPNFHQGLLLTSAAESLRLDGQPAETAWPYSAFLPSDLALWHPPTDCAVLKAIVTNHSATTATLVTLLDAAKIPVIIMMLSPSFYQPDATARIVPVPGEPILSSHAVIVAGYELNKDGTEFLVRNSWGDHWGDHGYGWVSDSYLAQRIVSVSTVTP